jgi:hypothetical protein
MHVLLRCFVYTSLVCTTCLFRCVGRLVLMVSIRFGTSCFTLSRALSYLRTLVWWSECAFCASLVFLLVWDGC